MSTATQPDHSIVEAASALLDETARLLRDRTVFLYVVDDDHLEFRTDGEDLPEELGSLYDERARYRAIVAEMATDRDLAEANAHHGLLRTDDLELHYVAYPVREGDGVRGVVGIHHRSRTDVPTPRELKAVECLGRELSDVVTRGSMLDELRDMLFNTVKSLVAAVDAKDVYTRGHSERVYRLAVAVGQHLALGVAEMQDLAWAALLHDIGKIAIPEEVLRKTESLTDEDIRAIQAHPVRGERLLQPIAQLAGVLPGIRHHHERVDGRGYPDRLTGEDIPFIARIIAVADTYDALVSTRAYRRARTREYALREIERSAGTQLDEHVVQAFLEIARADGSSVPGPEELSDAA